MYAIVTTQFEAKSYATNRRAACVAAFASKCRVYDIGNATSFDVDAKYEEVDVVACIEEELEKYKAPAKKRRKITSLYQEAFDTLSSEQKHTFDRHLRGAFGDKEAKILFDGLMNPLRPYLDVFRVFEALLHLDTKAAMLFAKWTTLPADYNCVAWNGSSHKAPKWLITMVKVHCFKGVASDCNLFIAYNSTPGTDIYRVTTCLKTYLEATAHKGETFCIWSTVNPVLVFTSS